jgi:hypothetical protein
MVPRMGYVLLVETLDGLYVIRCDTLLHAIRKRGSLPFPTISVTIEEEANVSTDA